MPLGIGTALWGVVLPVEKTNYFANPSYEFGSAGGTAIAAATIGTSAQYQQFGAWSLAVTPGVNGTAGAILGTWAAQTGTTYTASAYVRADVAFYTLALADGAGLNFVASGSVDFAGGGTWQRYSITYTESSNTNRALVLRKNGGANVLPFYADGVQVETGNLTTFFSGDDGGGTWLGAQQASQSLRSGQYRGGGSVVALADLGLSPDQFLGAGVPPIEVSTQSYAVTDGAQFQRQRAAQRDFTLTGKPINGTSLADFHVTRRTLYDAFKPDLVSTQQPVRFVYVGAQGTQQIDAYYKKGLELGNMDGPVAESVAITFTAPDPYWYAPTQQGTSLASYVTFGSANYVIKRSPLGAWGTLGNAGTSVDGTVYDFAFTPDASVYMGGTFLRAGGTISPHIARYVPSTNTWGTLAGGGTVGGAYILAITPSPSGSLFFGGFLAGPIGGTATQYIGQWNPSGFGSLVGGTVDDIVTSLIWTAGTLFAGGRMATAGGTAARFVAQWANNAWGTLTNGTVNNHVRALAQGLNGNLLLGGIFTSIAGSVIKEIAQWNGTMLPAGSGADGASSEVNALAVAPNGYMYAAGLFGTAGGVGGFAGVAAFNGIQYTSPGTNGAIVYYSLAVDPTTNEVYVGGNGSTTLEPWLTNLYRFDGANRLPVDVRLTAPTGDPDITAIAFAPDQTLYLGGFFAGSAIVGAVGTILNGGRASVYPVIRSRCISGTARVYRIANTTTGDEICFNTVLQAGEITTLTLQPGKRSFQSSYRGNIFGQILPGSNLATFDLLPGQNYISFFSDSANLETSIYWQSKGWAIDSGTVY